MSLDPLEGLNLEALTLVVMGAERWREVERRLQQRQLTLGWVPALEPEERIGALLERRGLGLRSTGYGEVAATCIGLSGVLAGGEPVVARAVPRSASGPDYRALLMGGAGQTGQVVSATLRVFRSPDTTATQAWTADAATSLFHGIAESIHRGAVPTLVLIDVAHRRALLTLEGRAALVSARGEILTEQLSRRGATPLATADAQAWLERVEHPASARSGEAASSMRIAFPWSRTGAVLDRAAREGVQLTAVWARHESVVCRVEGAEAVTPESLHRLFAAGARRWEAGLEQSALPLVALSGG